MVMRLAVLARLIAFSVVFMQSAPAADPAASIAHADWVTSTQRTYDAGAWHYWGNDTGNTRYAPLNQINAANVQRLKIAWRWSADTAGAFNAANFKSTPLLDAGVLYIPWLNNGIASIDAGTGKTKWTFEPQPADVGGGASLMSRALSFWSDGKNKRLLHNTLDGRLISVDAITGKPDPKFGRNGWINLRVNLTEGREVKDVRSVSPAIVIGDAIVAQVIPGGTRNKESVPGDIRGFDVRTGKMLWRFHVVPQPGEFGNDTWKNESWRYVGNSGSWTMMSADLELGYVYIATDTPSNDFSGVERPGDGLFAESILCLDAKTGKRVWHFQTVHHGIWDYDNPTAPILHDMLVNGKRIKAVTQLTKQGFVFVFNRVTGESIWPIEERAVPASKIPGEKLSPTQPFPTHPAPLTKQGYNEDWLIDFTPELRAAAIKIAEQYERGPLYTPLVEAKPGLRGTWLYPGFAGGPNWNGASVDPTTDIMYIPIRHKPYAVGLAKGDPARTNMAYVQTDNHTIMGPDGMPILKPPYSEMIAMDINKGEQLWRIPVGGAPETVRKHPALQKLKLDFDRMGNFDVRPSPLLTSELFFLGESGNLTGGTGTSSFRAYDKRNGKIVWETSLPTLVTGAPMTYMHKDRQYIVVAVSATNKPAELIAMTLDGTSENGSPPIGGVALQPAPPSTAAQAQAITATAEELALGEKVYSRACLTCHGPRGEGAIGPMIAGRTDFANIVRVIGQGQGEMPSLANSLTTAEIDTIAKHVVKTLQPQRRGPPQIPAERD
jgi:glucose dehydrogenase/mono/diheme cytochrome c family protein